MIKESRPTDKKAARYVPKRGGTSQRERIFRSKTDSNLPCSLNLQAGCCCKRWGHNSRGEAVMVRGYKALRSPWEKQKQGRTTTNRIESKAQGKRVCVCVCFCTRAPVCVPLIIKSIDALGPIWNLVALYRPSITRPPKHPSREQLRRDII